MSLLAHAALALALASAGTLGCGLTADEGTCLTCADATAPPLPEAGVDSGVRPVEDASQSFFNDTAPPDSGSADSGKTLDSSTPLVDSGQPLKDSGGVTDTGPHCTGAASCKPGMACDPVSGACGMSCVANGMCNGCCDMMGMCQPGTAANACGISSGTCANCSFRPNDKACLTSGKCGCAVSTDCLPNAACMQSQCVCTSNCPVGAACSGDSVCASNHCDSGSCTCNDATDCEPGSVCTNGKCIPMGSCMSGDCNGCCDSMNTCQQSRDVSCGLSGDSCQDCKAMGEKCTTAGACM